jgi:hypothetical protein
MMERKWPITMMNYLKKKHHMAPGMTKKKEMHDSKDEVQVIEGTHWIKWGGNEY